MHLTLLATLLVSALGVIAQDGVGAYHLRERPLAFEAGAGLTATLRFTALVVLTHLLAGVVDMSHTAGALERGAVGRF